MSCQEQFAVRGINYLLISSQLPPGPIQNAFDKACMSFAFVRDVTFVGNLPHFSYRISLVFFLTRHGSGFGGYSRLDIVKAGVLYYDGMVIIRTAYPSDFSTALGDRRSL